MFIISIMFVVWVLGWWKPPNTLDYKMGLIMGALVTFAAYIIGTELGKLLGWYMIYKEIK